MTMHPYARSAVATAAVTLLLSTLLACQKQDGPAEHAGKEIDKAVDTAGQKIDQAVDKAGKKIEEAGARLQEAAQPDKK